MSAGDKRELPVGVFDSGVGGISVLREMVRLLPGEDFLFFGDSANAPFGTKSMEQIRKLTLAAAEHLHTRGIKALVIACNTATSAAITDLREHYRDIPVIGIEPAIKPAAMPGEPGCRNVLVMATPFTIQGEKLHHLIDIYDKAAHIMPLACPGLVELVERGIFDGPEVDGLLASLLAPFARTRIDAVVLGCTHYPFLRRAIRKAVGEGPQILDGSEGTARQLARRLAQMELLAPERERPGQVAFEMSLPGREALCRKLLRA